MKVLVADDNESVRRAIVRLVSTDKNFEVCGEASNASDTFQKAYGLNPELILLDVSMPDTNGLDAARQLKEKFPDVRILIVSQHDASQLLPSSLEAGADGCIDKAKIGTDLLPILRSFLKK